ncbi:radical SAM protein [Desulfoluna sp.]|uniref:B12-binding domain-containing radical SAM protein n=1 Tax=Desulfoluna sp. TaxID=2045199 RepID=UPI00262C8991|nr:radical SAM protein [Desulfoluna sp.]
MPAPYFIVYNPMTVNVMDALGTCDTPLDLLSFLTRRDSRDLSDTTWLDFLQFDPALDKRGMVETFAIESYAITYVANQIAAHRPDAEIFLADGVRRTVAETIRKKGPPEAVFISSMSSNFPTTVCTTLALNHGNIPVIIGGIHVSTSPKDTDRFIRDYIPSPERVSEVRGSGDGQVIGRILRDLGNNELKQVYTGVKTIEDNVWGAPNVIEMPPLQLSFLKRIPLLGKLLVRAIRIQPIAPFLGCPHSCSFCSISSLPKALRRFTMRSPEDVVAEIEHLQKGGVTLKNRLFFFLPDNILLGGKRLNALLDLIIEKRLKINYIVQASVEIADDETLLKKLRLSGCSHLFIGFETLNLNDLKHVGKKVVNGIQASGKSVADYYAAQIKKIQGHGMVIHGSFILGLPNDRFHSLSDNTGQDYGKFCTRHHIGIQATPLSDLPGSRDFIQTHKTGGWLFGREGTMDYLIALVACDLTEGNRIPPANVRESPLIVLHMAYEAINRVGWTVNALKSATTMGIKGFLAPTINGKHSIKERLIDAFVAFAVPLIVSQYRDHAIKVLSSTCGAKGSMERLWEMEKDPEIKAMFRRYVEGFMVKGEHGQAQTGMDENRPTHPLPQDNVCHKTG